jgi:hypothetical protein
MKRVMALLVLLTACNAGRKIHTIPERIKGQVVFFLGIDCPVSQQYISRLNQLVKKYPDVRWRGYVPQNITQEQLDNFLAEYSVGFSLEKDKKLKAARRFDAKVMPEVFVLDVRGNTLYRGAIDNWFFDLGKHRTQTTEYYLENALESLLANTEPPVRKTEAIGCFIQRE